MNDLASMAASLGALLKRTRQTVAVAESSAGGLIYPHTGKALLQALVPADASGLATDGKWDTLGMRGTYSPSVTGPGAASA